MTIKEILKSQYLIFSLVSHTDEMSFDDVDDSRQIVADFLTEKGLPFIFGTGVDDNRNFIPYVFISVANIQPSASFELWQDIYNMIELLGQEIYLRGFNTQTFLMKTRLQVLATVKDIVFHGDVPVKNYFITDDGEAFSMDFKP